MRGGIVRLAGWERAARLEHLYRQQLSAKHPGLYSLKEGETGGANPLAPHPFSLCADGRLRSDCIGAALWGQGIDRYQQKRFPWYGGWCNTDSICIDALGDYVVTGRGLKDAKPTRALFHPVTAPRVGTLVVYPARYASGKKVNGSWGHILTVVHVGLELVVWPGLVAAASKLMVVHCHGGARGREVRAIARQTLRAAIGANVSRAHLIELVLPPAAHLQSVPEDVG